MEEVSTDFSSELKAFYTGGSDLNGLLAQLETYLSSHPEQAKQISTLFEKQYRSGRMPAQIYRVLTECAAQCYTNKELQTENETRIKASEGSIQVAIDQLPTDISNPEPSASDPQSIPTKGRPMVGDVLKHRFVLEEEIGRGGMGIVFKALDLRKEEAKDRDPYVAVKVLNADFHQDPEALIALQRECKKAQRLAHPNIATVYDFDRDQDTVYMTMELLEGESVEHLLKRLKPGALPFKAALPIIAGMVRGLAYAHEQDIVHSDFKPGNVFVLEKGTVKVLDFGIAQAVTRPGQTAKDATVFKPSWEALTPAYASCEMFDHAPADPRDDIYALACVSYELLAGKHPFNKLPANQARGQKLTPDPIPALNRQQNLALVHALVHDRNQRIASAEQFLTEITAGGAAIRNNALSWIAASILLLGIIGAGGYFLSAPDDDSPKSETSVQSITTNIKTGVGTPAVSESPISSQEEPASIEEEILDVETLAKIERILEMADLHFMIGRLVEPEGSNAYEAYQAVLAMQSSNSRAQEGLDEVVKKIEQSVQQNLERGDHQQALTEVESGLKYFPGNRQLEQLKQVISE